MAPKDEIEGMIAAQLLASHNATMECYHRAMLKEQNFESRRENLNQATKLSRTYALLLDALNRHRGKGQPRMSPRAQPALMAKVPAAPLARSLSNYSRV
jgi:hypothetical protein